jgi:hypothetical protein
MLGSAANAMTFVLQVHSTDSSNVRDARSGKLTRKDVDRMLRWRTFALLAGLLAVITVSTAYQPLDKGPVFLLALILFAWPMTWYLVSALRKRQVENSGTLKQLFGWSAGLAIALFTILLANGLLDQAPPQQIRCSLLRAYESTGRRSHYYHLIVRSWRPNHETENMEVGKITYQRASNARTVTLELHPGFFGMPWYGRVIPN